MVLNVFFQKSCSAFLVPAFRQCLRQQRLYDRGLSMSKFQRVIGFLDGFFRQMLFQENICENRMPTPRVGVNFHRPLHVRFCFGEFLFPHQRLAQSQQRRNMFGIKLQSLCPIGLSLLLSLHLQEINAVEIIHRGMIWSLAIGSCKVTPRLFWLVQAQRFQSLAQLLLDFRGKERLRGTRAGFSTPRRPHVNKDCRRSRTEGPKFFGNTFITGCSHLNGICACSYSFELYVAAQRCSLREDLPASGKQSNHCWHFEQTRCERYRHPFEGGGRRSGRSASSGYFACRKRASRHARKNAERTHTIQKSSCKRIYHSGGCTRL